MSAIADDMSVHSDRSGHRRSRSNRYYGAPHRRPSLGRTGGGTSSAEETLIPQKETKVEIVSPQEGDWPESNTCVTGNTSEPSYSCEDFRSLKFSLPSSPKASGQMRCARYAWLALAAGISLAAFLSPILMVLLPKGLAPLLASSWFNDSRPWDTAECGADCQGMLISFGFKLLILLIGVWALFVRRGLADLPRLFLARACILSLIFLLTFAYWLFYAVRIAERREPNYAVIVTFALSLVDALLFIHYLAVILLELRHLRPEFKIRVVRSPDGESRTYSVGHLSIQRAAQTILQNYYRDFNVYNPYLDRVPGGSNRMKLKGQGSQSNGPSGFKLYNLEGGPGGEGMADVNTQALMIAAARKRETGHNERFYEELEWERRVRKRRTRLLTAAEDAFGHIKRLHEEKGPCVPMDAHEAAQAVFPAVARSLQKYLRVTRQQPRHTAEQVVRHLANFLSFDMSPRSFIERFVNTQETFEGSEAETKWSIVCEQLVSRPLSHGCMFLLRCHCAGPDAGVQLLCTTSRLPFFNLTEEAFDSKNNRFVLRLSSETSV